MALQRWLEEGLSIKVELSTSGPLIIGGRQTELAFVPGGSSGIPLGWSIYLWGTGAAAGDVNLTTDSSLNRFSISNALSSAPNRSYGATYRFNVTPGHSYRIGIQARVMEGKSTDSAFTFQASGIRADGSNAGVLGFAYANQRAQADWTDYSIQTGAIAGDVNRIEILLSANAMPLTGAIPWGSQFSGLFYVETLPESEIEPTVWRDISCDAQGLTVRYGRERFTNRYDVGSCTLQIKNDDGQYTYREPHPFGLSPGRLIRITVDYAGTTYPLFYGVLDAIGEAYTLQGHVVVNFTCYDPQFLFSNASVTTLSGPIPLAGERIRRLLDLVGYQPRALDEGAPNWYMQNIVDSGRSVRDEMGITADSEGGSTFADRAGRIVYKDRRWLTTDPNLMQVTAQLVARPDHDNLPTVDVIPTQPGAPTICPFQLNTNWALDRMINHIELAYAGGNASVFDDKESQRQYGIFTYQRNDFVLYPYHANTYGWLAVRANDMMTGYSSPKLRVNSIAYRPGLTEEGWPWTLSVFLNWLVRVWYGNVLNGWGYAIVTHVQSVQHVITTKTWETTIALDQPISYADAPIVDKLADQWDNGKWDVSVWRRARFTQFARFNRAVFERGQAVSVFDVAKFDVNRFT